MKNIKIIYSQKIIIISWLLVIATAFWTNKTFYDRINLNNVELGMSNYYSEDLNLMQNILLAKKVYYPRDKCVDELKYESRKKLRWVYSSITRSFFGFIENLSNNKTSFFYILIYHFGLFVLTFYFIQKIIIFLYSDTSKLVKNYLYLFSSIIFSYLLYWTHVIHSGYFEFYTPFETMVIAATIYFAFKKNIYLFTIFLVFGIFNRESSFILALLWIIINNYKNIKSYIPMLLAMIIFILINYDVIHCIQNKEFLSPTLSNEDVSLASMFLNSITNTLTNWNFIYFILFTSLLFLVVEKRLFAVYVIYLLYAIALFKSSPASVHQPYFVFVPMLIILIMSNINKIYLKYTNRT